MTVTTVVSPTNAEHVYDVTSLDHAGERFATFERDTEMGQFAAEEAEPLLPSVEESEEPVEEGAELAAAVLLAPAGVVAAAVLLVAEPDEPVLDAGVDGFVAAVLEADEDGVLPVLLADTLGVEPPVLDALD